MCGRYTLFTSEEYRDILRIIEEVGKRFPDQPVKTGDIYPTNRAPVLARGNAGLAAEPCVWGFPQYRRSGVLINARAETACEKHTFQTSLLNSRCVVPTTGFYEWDKQKNKRWFRAQAGGVLYLAGLKKVIDGQSRFVIMTTRANASVANVHERMPLILPPERLFQWVSDTDWALAHLHSAMPAMEMRICP